MSTTVVNPTTSSANTGTNILRITGMATGIDTDATVKALLTPYQTKLDKLKQDMQTMQWTQDSYRDTMTDVNTFKSTYFDLTNPATNMLSMNSYADFNTTAYDAGTTNVSSAVSATGGAGAVSGGYKVSFDNGGQIATAAGLKSGSATQLIANSGTTISQLYGSSSPFAEENISISYDDGTGNTTSAVVDVKPTDTLSSLAAKFSTASNGSVVANFDNTTGKFTIQNATPLGTSLLNVTGGESILGKLNLQNGNAANPQSVAEGDATYGIAAQGSLGTGVQSSGAIQIPSTAVGSSKLSQLFSSGAVDTTAISITYDSGNGAGPTTKSINISANMSISDLTQAINSATSNAVVAQYSELTGKLSLSTAVTGANTAISLTETNGSLLEKFNIGASAVKTQGQDLKVTITPPGEAAGTTITRSSNNFTVDGVTYNFTSAKNADINLTTNVQTTFDGIKAFIDKYNSMISKINTKITENKPNGYPPLTDTQRASMSATDITNWEAKAKTGLLENDSMLQNMLDSMRSAFYQTVQGAGITLTQIGLSTSSDITQGGKIIIDETKLKAAIQNNGPQVANLFAQASTSQPTYSPDLNATDRATRSNEEGIFQRINDVLQDYTRTTRDSGGHKGMLVDKAGIVGDYTEFNNLITTQETAQQKAITDMTQKMSDKQTQLYNQFANLEAAMNTLNSQSSWLTQQLGGSSN